MCYCLVLERIEGVSLMLNICSQAIISKANLKGFLWNEYYFLFVK